MAADGASPRDGRMNTVDPESMLAAAYLSRVAEPASLPVFLLVRQLGYLAAAEAIRSGDVTTEVRQATEARRTNTDAEADLEAAERNDIRLVTALSDEWPHYAFASMHAVADRRVAEWLAGGRKRPDRGELIPPLALWLKGNGDLSGVGVRSAAVVGSRAATAYGEHVAADLAYGLASRDVTVVSGGAHGIDAAAHRGALSAGGTSVLVSAGGLDRPYPSANELLYSRTAESGVLVSERPPGSAPHRQRFLSRNRLIAALGSATLVVEAAQRSGALNSARYARDLGRPVLAVPGPVTSAMSTGCHQLIQREENPAVLVTGLSDVLPYCGSLGEGRELACKPAALNDYDGLDEAARAVLDGFPAHSAVTESDLARLSGRPVQEVLVSLPTLRQLGLISVSREGYRRSLS
ncbi:MAG: processing protein [Pseudonocardiales bacterium]|nr:processing protein [Pseudonocardiales bacterium]